MKNIDIMWSFNEKKSLDEQMKVLLNKSGLFIFG